MSKQGIYKISGNTKPKVGEPVTYKIEEWYPATPLEKRNPARVTWHLFKKVNGKFVPTNIKKVGVSSFTFNTNAYKDTFRIEAYLHNPEGKAPMALEVQPQPSDVPRINKVELKYIDDTPGTVFSFSEKLVAEAKCMNLEGQYLQFTLWEDDAQNAGHNNKNLLIGSKKEKVKNETARAEFILTQALMKKAMEGETDPKQLEFYVTVEYYAHKKHATDNININTPKEILPPEKSQTKTDPSPPPKKEIPKEQPKKEATPAEQKGKSQKEEKEAKAAPKEDITDKDKKVWDWSEAKGKIDNQQPPTPTPPKEISPAQVNSVPDPQKTETCICKENQFNWGIKLTCEERKKVLQVCAELWGEQHKKEKASELMSVMHLETNTTFSPAADNNAGYSGLIQFSDASAKSVGSTRAALKKMTFVQQMDYVKKYFEKKKAALKTMTDLYLLVLKQNAVGQGANGDYVLFDESVSVPNAPYDINNLSREPWVTKYGYSSNPSFMREKGEWAHIRKFNSYSRGSIDRRGFENGKTYVWEVTDKLVKEHYNPGKAQFFNGTCEEKPQEKKKSNGKYPPWVDIAIAEEAKIIRESTHCSYIINTYHASTDNAKMSRCGSEKDASRANSAWCGAFVAYCLKTSGHKYQPDPGAIWHGKENLVKRKKGAPYETEEKWGKKYTEMYIGGIVEWHNNGHTTIVVGIDKSNSKNYILLGGNQDNGVRFWTAPKTKVHAYCIFPADYTGDLLPLESIEPSDLSPKAQKYSEGNTA
ncbi:MULTISPECIES: hypothetical protein [unclassified Chryseobacterium]|uniref:hypothetical protein n=1 Tax=unclassified Chryseobacterium TaxID=2593645 RepID=UPI00100A5520|nr:MULTISPECIES: hypothetical protein [unclassified Chryseobacterium]RXM49970.1 hypothetical protein BOQ64_20835 [Chryseobacterium sp. CH25]RXM62886.1 hypothetical protein BOQ60_18590 [Chryseobacterium sp. CH1]